MRESALIEASASRDTRGMGRRAAGEWTWRGIGIVGVDSFIDAN